MCYRFILLCFLISIIFSQTQVVIVEEMFMDAPYVGKVITTNTKYATENIFKQEMQVDVDRFLVRIAMGGNKKAGTIIDGNSHMRYVYDSIEEEYAEENFQSILSNDGKPRLKMMDNAFGGDGENRSSNDNEDTDELNDANGNNNQVVRTIAKESERIGNLISTKVTTEMSGSDGKMIIEEWFTTDTSLFRYVLDVESELISAYGGQQKNTPRSFSESMLKNIGHEFESVEGQLVKYNMTQKDSDGDDGFKMSWTIKQIKEDPFNQSDFILSKDYKKVDDLN